MVVKRLTTVALTTLTIFSSLHRTFASNPWGKPKGYNQDLQWITTDTMDSQAVASYREAYANPEALERSLALVVQRHEVLRTTFPLQEEQPVQAVAPSLPIQLAVIDLHGLPADKLDHQVVELARAEAQRPFDLTHGPLLRVSLLRLSRALPLSTAPQEHILLFTLQHIVSDGWSNEILLREIAQLYQAQMNGEVQPNLLPELPIQYVDYTLWQQQWLQGEVLESQLSYWRQQLAGMPALLELPTDRPRPAVQRYVGAQQVLLVPLQLLEPLKSLSQREGVTLFMTLLATFQVLLMRYSGQHDSVVGTPLANRTREEVEGLIGFFVNTLVLRTDLSGNPSFRTLLARADRGNGRIIHWWGWSGTRLSQTTRPHCRAIEYLGRIDSQVKQPRWCLLHPHLETTGQPL